MSFCRFSDVVIIGGGPAGMAAALWCDELGLTSCLLEKANSLGGQLSWIHNPILNYPGASFDSGLQCLTDFETSLADRRFEFYPTTEVHAILPQTREVVTSGGMFAGKSIVIATGVRRRQLEVPGEEEFAGKGILDSGSKDRRQVEGLEVAVIGGGDAALENALILAEFAKKVYLIHRRDSFSARAEFVDAIAANSKIESLLESRVERFGGEGGLEFIESRTEDGSTRRLDVSKAVVRVGVVPNSEIVRGISELDQAGYIKVNHLCQTSADGIFAIGDVANPVSPTIASAAGSAATAIKAITRKMREFE